MKHFSSMDQSSFSSKKTTIVLFLLFGLEGILILFANIGCYPLPRSIPRWHGGMDEVPMNQESYQEEWNQSYGAGHQTVSRSTVPKTSTESQKSQKSSSIPYNVNKANEPKISFHFFKKIFGQSLSNKTNRQQPSINRSDELFADNLFYPADIYQTSFDYQISKSDPNFRDSLNIDKTIKYPIQSDNLSLSSKTIESDKPASSDLEVVSNVHLENSGSVAETDSLETEQLISANQSTIDDSFETTLPRSFDITQKKKLSQSPQESLNEVFDVHYIEEILAKVDANQLPGNKSNRSICNLIVDYNQQLNLSPIEQQIADNRLKAQKIISPVRYQPQNESTDRIKHSSFELPLTNQEISETTDVSAKENVSNESIDLVNAPSNWKEQTLLAIESLEKEIENKQQQKMETSEDEFRLQILKLSIGKSDLNHSEPSEDNPIQQFWMHQLNGMSTLLNSANLAADSNATIQVASELQKGLDSLTQICPIQIRKAILVENAAQFGLYQKKIGSYRPGSTVYIYAELEYVHNRETTQGHEMCALCSWELVDINGRTVLPKTEQSCSSTSESRLRDIVLNISIDLPPNLQVGTYQLIFSVLDKNNPVQPSTSKEIQLQVVR
ncbi:MAG: hypothetical protein Q4C95_06745 [Planctomycetia bacterium]|nr:hypothetical protein [Planctomycetia bacterium]